MAYSTRNIELLNQSIDRIDLCLLLGNMTPKLERILWLKRAVCVYTIDLENMDNTLEVGVWKRTLATKKAELIALGCKEAVDKFEEKGYWT